jgi:hypothetical protein
VSEPTYEEALAFLEHHGGGPGGFGEKHAGTQGVKTATAKREAKAASKPVKLSRKDVRVEKQAFYQKKAEHLLKTAVDNPDVLIGVSNGSPIPTVVTGKEFVNHMSRGGMMNVRYTDIYATKDPKSGSYVLNPTPNQKFVRSDKRK